MPLILESNSDNKLEFEYEGGSAVLYWADPTTKQRIDYSNRLIKRQGRKITNDLAATRLAGGLAICTGMREGDFAIPAKNKAGFELISSDPKSKNYRKDWKELLQQYQSDYLMLLGAHAFENTSIGGLTFDDDETDSLAEPVDSEEVAADLGK